MTVLILFVFALAGCKDVPPAPAPTPTADPAAEAESYLQDGDLAGAAAYWRDVLENQPDSPIANYRLGLILSVLQPEEAAQYLEKAAALEPAYQAQVNRVRAALRQMGVVDDRAYQLTLIGQALASVEEWRLAEAALRQAVEDAPNYPEAWAYLGEVLQHTDQDGYPALQTAIRLDPTSYAANVFMGLYWRRNDKPDEALRYLQVAAEADPDNLSLLQDLAYTLVQAGLVEEALDEVYQAVETDPENSQAWLLLAKISIEHDIQVAETGIPAARQLVVMHPDEAEPLLLLGRAYILLGNTQLAERFLSQASLAAPTWAEPDYYLGLMYFNLGQVGPAEAHLQRAVRLAEVQGNEFISQQAQQILEQFLQ